MKLRHKAELRIQVGAELLRERQGQREAVDGFGLVRRSAGVVECHSRGDTCDDVSPTHGLVRLRRDGAPSRVATSALSILILGGDHMKDGAVEGVSAVDAGIVEIDRPRQRRVREQQKHLHVGERGDRREELLDPLPQGQESLEIEARHVFHLTGRVRVQLSVVKATAGRRHGAHGQHHIGYAKRFHGKGAATVG